MIRILFSLSAHWSSITWLQYKALDVLNSSIILPGELSEPQLEGLSDICNSPNWLRLDNCDNTGWILLTCFCEKQAQHPVLLLVTKHTWYIPADTPGPMSKSNSRGCCFCFQKSRSPSPPQQRTSPSKENPKSPSPPQQRTSPSKEHQVEESLPIQSANGHAPSANGHTQSVTEGSVIASRESSKDRSVCPVKEAPSVAEKSVVSQVSPPTAVPQNNNKATSSSTSSPVTAEDIQFVVVKSTIPKSLSPPVTTTATSPSRDSTTATSPSRDSTTATSPSRDSLVEPSEQSVDDLLREAKLALAGGGLSAEMEAQLSSLVARLEVVTNRLESAATKSSSPGGADSGKIYVCVSGPQTRGHLQKCPYMTLWVTEQCKDV